MCVLIGRTLKMELIPSLKHPSRRGAEVLSSGPVLTEKIGQEREA